MFLGDTILYFDFSDLSAIDVKIAFEGSRGWPEIRRKHRIEVDHDDCYTVNHLSRGTRVICFTFPNSCLATSLMNVCAQCKQTPYLKSGDGCDFLLKCALRTWDYLVRALL